MKDIKNIKLFDATLRDGSHAIEHQFTAKTIENYCQAIDGVGMHTVLVGHGNGLGASSLQVGLSLLPEREILSIARKNLSKTKLGIYMIPGFETIRDNLIPAIEEGVEVFKIGCNCTEANITRQHIEFLKEQGKEVYGVLMMYHLASAERILEESMKMESYGADGVILMDSAGASTPEMVKEYITLMTSNLKGEVGFHAHNNLGIAVANAYTAILNGATIVDGTVRGFGAGAGNCQLDAFVALMKREGYDLGVDFYKMLDVSENIVKHFIEEDNGLSALNLVNGVAGVCSAFRLHVVTAARDFNVNPYELLMELGRRKVVAGQEDMIVHVAEDLRNNRV